MHIQLIPIFCTTNTTRKLRVPLGVGVGVGVGVGECLVDPNLPLVRGRRV